MIDTSYQILTFAPTSPPAYAHDLAAQALKGARAGKRVALLLWGASERRSIERAVSQLLAPVEVAEWSSVPVCGCAARASMPRRIDLQTGGFVYLVTYAEELMGQDYDLVVASGSVRDDSDLMKEARGRLRLRGARA